MRARHTVGLATAGLITALGLPAPVAAAEVTILHVNNTVGGTCSDSGPGSEATPFCSIGRAAELVEAGQTVQVEGDRGYDENVTLTHSGTPDKPITFRGAMAPGNSDTAWLAGDDTTTGRPTVTLTGVHDVAIQRLGVVNGVAVTNSSRVTLEDVKSFASNVPSFDVNGGSGVTIRRSWIYPGSTSGVLIHGGADGTVVSHNQVSPGRTVSIEAADATRTAVVNNTVQRGCGPAIALTGAATDSTVVNNVLAAQTADRLPDWACAAGSSATEISVAAAALPGTRTDYNALIPNAGATAYSWNGAAYQDLAAFRAATGQGAHDLLLPPATTYIIAEGSPLIDSADATAPGALATDQAGRPAADDPNVPNTGTGIGYLDRGATELQDKLSGVTLTVDRPWAPIGTTVTATAKATDDWPAALTYHFDFGDGTVVDTASPSAGHVYATVGDRTVKVTATNGVGTAVSSQDVAVKATLPDQLAPAFTVADVLPTSTDPIGHTPPLSVTVDTGATASSWPITASTVDFGDGTGAVTVTYPAGTGHTYTTPGDYTVKLTVRDDHGHSAVSSKVFRAAYAPSGYLPTDAYRVLDTRQVGNGGGAAGGVVQTVKIPIGLARPGAVVSGSIASVVLNLTATGATEDTHLTVWPAGQPRPATSNLNIAAGRTTANLVTVPLGAGESVNVVVNSGRAQVVLDVVGYYQPNVGDRFTTGTPTRLLDTRTGTRLGADETRRVKVAGVNGVPANATAVTVNLTSTDATADTFFTLWSGDRARPVSTSLNPTPRQDRSNQVIVPIGADGTISLYNHEGSAQAVVDVFGWYAPDGQSLYTPVSPLRLGDTRTGSGGKPGADSTTVFGGVPAGATAAVLNVTAVEPTDSSYLTVFAHGSARPVTSNLNVQPGVTVANQVTTPVGPDGRFDVYNHAGSTHLAADLLGYFSKP